MRAFVPVDFCSPVALTRFVTILTSVLAGSAVVIVSVFLQVWLCLAG